MQGKDWKSVIPHFEDLRRIKIKTLLVEYAIEYAKEKVHFIALANSTQFMCLRKQEV